MKTAKVSASAPRLADRYIRCDDFTERIDGIELAPEIWAVFAQLTQSRTADELARHLKLDVEAVNAALRRLVRRKLIRKHVLAWRDYAASVTTTPATTTHFEGSVPPFRETTPPVASTTVGASPTRSASPFPFAPPVAPAPVAIRSPIISFRISSSTASTKPAPTISLRIESTHASVTSPTPAASTTGGPRLRPILDAIGAKAGGGIAGQLLVYRVFLQIPTELMHAAGLHSLSLVDDTYTIPNQELRNALVAAARQHAGVDIDALTTA